MAAIDDLRERVRAMERRQSEWNVAPVGLCDSGLPVGIQIIGARFEDRTTIAFAKGFSELLGGFKAPPGYED